MSLLHIWISILLLDSVVRTKPISKHVFQHLLCRFSSRADRDAGKMENAWHRKSFRPPIRMAGRPSRALLPQEAHCPASYSYLGRVHNMLQRKAESKIHILPCCGHAKTTGNVANFVSFLESLVMRHVYSSGTAEGDESNIFFVVETSNITAIRKYLSRYSILSISQIDSRIAAADTETYEVVTIATPDDVVEAECEFVDSKRERRSC